MRAALEALRTTIAAPSDAISVLLILGAGILAFAAVAAAMPLVIRLAHARKWVAKPAEDRWHTKPTALMGGIGIFLGVLLSTTLFVDLGRYLFLTAGACLMFVAGFVDDRLGLRPLVKLMVQLAAAAMLVLSGWSFSFNAGQILSIGVTVFWVLGIVNAVNLVDNMDGLASGIAGIAALSLAAMALMAGAGVIAVVALSVGGAAAGFLLYNKNPARIFMGDSGSLFLGYMLAALAVMVQSELGMHGFTAVWMTALVLGVPILDTVLVTIVRTLHNRPISQGGRDHTSHRLVRAGLSERQAVLLLYGLSALFAVLAPAFYAADARLRVSFAIFTLIGAAVFAGQIGSADVYGETEEDVGESEGKRRNVLSALLLLPRQILGSAWKPMLAVLADILICTGSFVLAHHLRFEAALTPDQERFLLLSLPVVLAIRIPVFALFRFYRAIWRHAGALDIARVMAAVTITSVLAYVGLGFLHGFADVPRGVIVIDWMAVTLGILFSRFGFRGLRSYLSAVSPAGRAVAVYGADADGAATIRLLRSNGHAMRPVAIIDMRSDLRGGQLQGVPVIGGLEKLEQLHRSGGVSELIIPEHGVSEQERRRIERACEAAGMRFRAAAVIVGQDNS